MRCTELNENKRPEGTRREGPPFPVNSRTKTQQSMAKIPNSREEKRGTGRRGAPGKGGSASVLAQGAKEKERARKRGVRGYLTPNNSQPKRLNYP